MAESIENPVDVSVLKSQIVVLRKQLEDYERQTGVERTTIHVDSDPIVAPAAELSHPPNNPTSNNEVNELTEVIEKLHIQLEETISDLSLKQSLVLELQEKVLSLEGKLAERRLRNDAFDGDQSLDEKNYELEMKNQSLSTKIIELEEDLTRLRLDHTDLEEHYEIQSEELEKYTKLNETNLSKISESEMKYNDEVARLQKLLRKLESEKIELSALNEKDRKSAELLNTQLNQKQDEVDNLEIKLSRFSDDNDASSSKMEEKISNLESELTQLKNEHESINNKKLNLEILLVELREEIKSINLTAENDLNNKINEMKKQFELENKSKDELNDKNILTLNGRISSIEQKHLLEIEEKNSKISELESEIVKMKASLSELDLIKDSNEQAKSTIRNLEYEIGVLLSRKSGPFLTNTDESTLQLDSVKEEINDVEPQSSQTPSSQSSLKKSSSSTISSNKGSTVNNAPVLWPKADKSILKPVNKDETRSRSSSNSASKSEESILKKKSKEKSDIPIRKESNGAMDSKQLSGFIKKRETNKAPSINSDLSSIINLDTTGNGLKSGMRYKIEVVGISSKKGNSINVQTAKYLMEQLVHREEMLISGKDTISRKRKSVINKSPEHALSKFLLNNDNQSSANKGLDISDISASTGLNVEDEKDIEALISTMSGGWFQKFNRHGKNPQPRYSWINPYTRTINWSTRPPNQNQISGNGLLTTSGSLNASVSNSNDIKSASIGSLSWDEPDANVRRYPPQLEHVLRIGMSQGSSRKELNLVPTSWREHDDWVRGIALLLAKSDTSKPKYTSSLI